MVAVDIEQRVQYLEQRLKDMEMLLGAKNESPARIYGSLLSVLNTSGTPDDLMTCNLCKYNYLPVSERRALAETRSLALTALRSSLYGFGMTITEISLLTSLSRAHIHNKTKGYERAILTDEKRKRKLIDFSNRVREVCK